MKIPTVDLKPSERIAQLVEEQANKQVDQTLESSTGIFQAKIMGLDRQGLIESRKTSVENWVAAIVTYLDEQESS